MSRSGKSLDGLPNVYGWELWVSGEFWLLFAIMSICMSLRRFFLGDDVSADGFSSFRL